MTGRGRDDLAMDMTLTPHTSVYLTLSEAISLEEYLRAYLKSRRLPVDGESLAWLQTWVARCPAAGR